MQSLLLSIGILLLGACAGLSSEPEVASTRVPLPTPIPVEANADLGQTIFLTRCAGCHGETGAGDGPVALDADMDTPDFTVPTAADGLSFEQWVQVIEEGRIDKLMPPWKDSLSTDEIQAVAKYTYAMAGGTLLVEAQTTVASVPEQAPQLEDAAAEIEEVVGSVSGSIRNGTTDSPLDGTVSVGLHVLDEEMQEVVFDVNLAENGSYHFDDVPIRIDQTYMVTLLHEETLFYSDIVFGSPSSPDVELPIQVYETTNNPDVVEINAMVTRISQDGDDLIFEHIMNFRNTSDRMFRGVYQLDGFRTDSIHIKLPPGAEVLNTLDLVPRFVMEVDGRTVIDTDPVIPGADHIVEVVYALPINRVADGLEITFPIEYDMVNQVELMLQPSGFEIVSDQVVNQGMRQFEAGMYASYLGEPLSAGDTLTYTIRPGSIIHEDTETQTRLLPVVMVIAGAGLMVASGAAYWFTAYQSPQAQKERLLSQITALDSDYYAGRLDETLYQEERSHLKARLVTVIQQLEAKDTFDDQ